MNSELANDPDRRRREIAYEATYEADVVNYVPGEICIVVSAAPHLSPEQLHDAVRTTLNRHIFDFLTQGVAIPAPVRVDDELQRRALAEDLQFPLVLERFRSRQAETFQHQPEFLFPLVRLLPGSAPIVALPRTDRTTAVVVYQIAADVTIRPEPMAGGNDAWRVKRQRLLAEVRELVLIVNQQLRDLAFTQELQIVAATPNWLTTVSAASAGGSGCGSPGGLPRPISRAQAPEYLSRLFEFGNDQLREFERRAQEITEGHVKGEPSKPNGVVVAVLDTSPRASQVRAAATSPSIEEANNWLLPLVSARVAIDGALSESESSFDTLAYRPNWHGPERDHEAFPDDASFAMADHGLFVAGVVYHLAPAAEIHLIRVLDDCGVGDMLAIARVLRQLPGQFLESTGHRLIVNLSLGAEVPPSQRFPIRWFPNLARAREWPASGPLADFVANFRDTIHRGLRETIDWLSEQGVLVVAAVGNDNYIQPTGRKEPRYPAAYDCVLGVAATKSDDVLADYTNLGDEPRPTALNGIATFGGNATLVGGPGNGPALTDAPPNAVKGIFSADTLPLNGGNNETGWVEWAGTSSFATPVISAIAANLWADDIAQNGTMSPASLMQAIYQLAEPVRPGSVPTITASVP